MVAASARHPFPHRLVPYHRDRAGTARDRPRYRDPTGPCVQGTHLTNGVAVTFTP